MQILFLDPFQTLLLDINAWLVIHLGLGYLSSRLPLDWLNPAQRLFRTFSWEKDGEIYQKFFHIRSWKHLIPSGSRLYRGAFSIQNLPTHDPTYLEGWLKESVRAEICHWAMIIPCFLFFLWNSIAIGWGMVAYALLNNIFPIILQRYNRPRMRKLLAQLERKNSKLEATTISL